ncbi:gem-associated protein 6-like [Gouania willdenowi]|uniref:Gem-associated protein 6 n=1 Tax=Gouania willdenowi TaxID=441366 RepID=A0A8C5N706_GOUWI|nr:gem-associated protein 6-like [Gouania willdenowi]
MLCDWLHLGPQEWLQFVNKEVKVKAGNDDELRGWLHTVDPVSASLVLVTFGHQGASVVVLMGHAVRELQVLREADEVTSQQLRTCFLPHRKPRLEPQEVKRRKAGLQRWLEENRLPVEEDGERLVVGGALSVAPPYGPEDCESSNQIILLRIQSLIRDAQLHTD